MLTIGNLFDKIIDVQSKTIQKINYVALSSTTITYKGNEFNGPNKLVQLDTSGCLPRLDAHNLINLPLDNYLTTTEINQLLSTVLESYIQKSDIYTKSEIDNISSSLITQINATAAQTYIPKTVSSTFALNKDLLSTSERLDTAEQDISGLVDLIDDLQQSINLINVKTPVLTVNGLSGTNIQLSANNLIGIDKYLMKSELKTEINDLQTDPIFAANSGKFALTGDINDIEEKLNINESDIIQLSESISQLSSIANNISGKPIVHPVLSVNGLTGHVSLKISDFQNDKNYLTIQTQSDPIFTANSGKFALKNEVYKSHQIDSKLSGKADLVNGLIPASQLPSYVDDVLEVYLKDAKIYSDQTCKTELNPQTGKIYIDLFTNKQYRWSGTGFAQISSSLAIGDKSGMAFDGRKGLQLTERVIELEDNTVKKNQLSYPVSSVNGKTGDVVLKTSDLIDDVGFLTSYVQTDPIFTANSGKFALKSQLSSFIIDQADPIFAANSGQFALTSELYQLSTSLNINKDGLSDLVLDLNTISSSLDDIKAIQIEFPVSSVNGKTGNVILKTSDLVNDSQYITSDIIPVSSINNKTGNVILKLSDLQNDTNYITTNSIPVSSVNGKTGNVVLKISDLENDNGYLTSYIETDPLFTANSGQFALKSELSSFIIDQLDPKFSTASSQFALKSQLSSFITDQVDPLFTANSGKFALKSQLSSFITNQLDPKFSTASSQFALKSQLKDQTDPIFTANSGKFVLKQQISNLITNQIDPIFTAHSGKFVLKSQIKDQIDPIFTEASSKFALTGDITNIESKLNITEEDMLQLSDTLYSLSSQVNNISGQTIDYPVSSVNGLTGNVVLSMTDIIGHDQYLTEQTQPLFTSTSSKFVLSSQFDIFQNEFNKAKEDITWLEDSFNDISEQIVQLQSKQIIFPVSSVNGKTGNVVLKISDLENDNGYLTSYIETDPIFTANSGQFVLKSQINNIITNQVDPLFAANSGKFALKSQLSSFITDQIDPLFTANSGQFVLKSQLKDQIDPIFTANSGKFALVSAVYTQQQIDLKLSNKADLVNGLIPASQLPSYVDDVLEVYLKDNNIYSDQNCTNKLNPQSGKIYIDLFTNKQYRWSGTGFAQISSSLAIGDKTGMAFDGGKGLQLTERISELEDNTVKKNQLSHPVSSVNGKTGDIILKTSDLENDNGYLTSYIQSDPIFTANSSKFVLKQQISNFITDQIDPLFTANSSMFVLSSEMDTLTTTLNISQSGLINLSTSIDRVSAQLDTIIGVQNVIPVSSVNGLTGDVILKMSDLDGAENYLTHTQANNKYAIASVINQEINQLSTQVLDIISGSYLSGLNETLDNILKEL